MDRETEERYEQQMKANEDMYWVKKKREIRLPLSMIGSVTPPSPPAERPVKLSDKDSKIIQELFRLKNMKSNTNEQQREKNQQIIDFIDENIHKINNQVKELFNNTRDKEQKNL